MYLPVNSSCQLAEVSPGPPPCSKMSRAPTYFRDTLSTHLKREEFRIRWCEEQEVIGCGLLGIKEIFGNAEALADKDRLLPRESRSLDPSFLVPSKIRAICGNSTNNININFTFLFYLNK